MSIQGTLETMSLQEVLRWAAQNSKTGIVELERNKVRKRIAFREGRIVGCSSDDPPSRIGQFLLSRGKITKEALAKALKIQQEQKKPLGEILRDICEIDAQELARELSEKAEETIYGLFDWTHAVFRFVDGEPNDPWLLDYHAPLEEILERGTQRRKQFNAIRRLFVNSGVVLEHGSERVPAEIMNNGLVCRILESIDGVRTIGEVVFYAHASEFLVLKFLASAVHSNFLAITEIREVDPRHPTLLDEARPTAAAQESDPQPELAATVAAPESTFEEKIELAQHFLAQEEAEAALDVLDECYEERPEDKFLGHVIRKAESLFIYQCRTGDFGSHLVPSRIAGKELEPSHSRFSAAEKYLMGIMGEGHSIQTLNWIAPMRETDVYRALARMKCAGVIELDEPAAATATEAPKIEWG